MRENVSCGEQTFAFLRRCCFEEQQEVDERWSGRLVRGGWQDLDIAACIPEATGLISSHDNVPRNVDSPPLSSIAWREYLCRVACRVRQLRDCILREQVLNSAVALFFKLSLHHCILTCVPLCRCRNQLYLQFIYLYLLNDWTKESNFMTYYKELI